MDTEGEGGRGGKGQRASVNHTPARHAAQLTSEPLPAKNQLERSSQAVRGESRAQRGNEPPACASSASLSSTAMRDPRFAREKRLPSSSAIALCDLSLLPHAPGPFLAFRTVISSFFLISLLNLLYIII